MKRLIVLIMAIASLVGLTEIFALAAEGKQECPSINLNALGMRKELSNDWKPNNEQDELGGSIDLRPATWPVALEVGYLYATKKGNADTVLTSGNTSTAYNNLQQEAVTEEAFAGVKKIWTNEQRFSLFVSAGATWIKGTLKFADVGNFDASKAGWYASLGGYYTLFNFLNLGIIGRYSDNKLNIVGRDINAGGFHYGVLAGIHF